MRAIQGPQPVCAGVRLLPQGVLGAAAEEVEAPTGAPHGGDGGAGVEHGAEVVLGAGDAVGDDALDDLAVGVEVEHVLDRLGLQGPAGRSTAVGAEVSCPPPAKSTQPLLGSTVADLDQPVGAELAQPGCWCCPPGRSRCRRRLRRRRPCRRRRHRRRTSHRRHRRRSPRRWCRSSAPYRSPPPPPSPNDPASAGTSSRCAGAAGRLVRRRRSLRRWRVPPPPPPAPGVAPDTFRPWIAGLAGAATAPTGARDCRSRDCRPCAPAPPPPPPTRIRFASPYGATRTSEAPPPPPDARPARRRLAPAVPPCRSSRIGSRPARRRTAGAPAQGSSRWWRRSRRLGRPAAATVAASATAPITVNVAWRRPPARSSA